jgi:hypothetical protein
MHKASDKVKGEMQKASDKRSEEENLQTALRLMDMGLKDKDVLKSTLLSPERLEEIKRNNNK